MYTWNFAVWFQFYASEVGTERKDGWGSAEATEMVLNNIFYITAKVIVLQNIYFDTLKCTDNELI